MENEENPRQRRFPQIAIRLNWTEYTELWQAASRQLYRRTDGEIQPGRLLRALVGVLWPKLRQANFEVLELKRVLASAGETRDSVDRWLRSLFESLPEGSKFDIMRGIADTYNFREPLPEEMNDTGKSQTAKGDGKGKRPAALRRGGRRNV